MKYLKTMLVTLLAAISFNAFAAGTVITFNPSTAVISTDAQPFTCDVQQDAFAFTASLYGTPAPCSVANLLPTYGSLTAGKVGVYASYGMSSPFPFILNSVNLKYVQNLKGYPGLYLTTFDAAGDAIATYNVPYKATGAYDLSAYTADGVNGFRIQARTASRLELTNVNILLQ